ncbi:MAG TPA: MBL fold metallo-hydrolase [Rhodanobacteraceae bacterium]|nr:MBL fold metallo-hydrolase [Rhodanobacteraceae bacterium]
MADFLEPYAPTADGAGSLQTADGHFRNAAPRPVQAGPKKSRWKLMWEVFFEKPKNTRPRAPIPVCKLTRAELDAAPERSLYRLGHSTLLIKLRGRWWLTDPVFSLRASPFSWFGPKRFHAPPIAIDALPPIRGVILSHDHYDHLDHAAILALAGKVETFLTPLGVGDRLVAWGIARDKVRQFDWWQGTEVEGVRFTATPAQHFSGRTLRDGNLTLWCSWVIDDGERRVFFSGDSGYFAGFAEIGRRFGPFDLTLMETGAYNVQWPYVHMRPEQTVQAHEDLVGRWLLPIHNGTFDLSTHPWYEPFELVLALGSERAIFIATPVMGERISIDAPHAGKRWWRGVMTQEHTSKHFDTAVQTGSP